MPSLPQHLPLPKLSATSVTEVNSWGNSTVHQTMRAWTAMIQTLNSVSAQVSSGIVSVKDAPFFAKGDGVTDDTTAFSLAAQTVTVAVNVGPYASNGITMAPMGRVRVPPGTYLLTQTVDTGGRDITWVLDQGATVTGYAYLNGRVEREGERINNFHYGILDAATNFSLMANRDLEQPASVSGYTGPTQIATYTDRDSVTFFADNLAPAPTVDIANASTTYTATTIVPGIALTADQVKHLRIGMMIDTKHATKYSGFITAWAANGTSITVASWYLSPGPGTPATPANGTGAYVNPITKIWAHNANVSLAPASLATNAAGFELGVVNTKADFDISTPTINRTWAFDAVNLGTKRAEIGFYQRADFYHGFSSVGAFQSAFHVEYNGAGQHPDYGLFIEDIPDVAAVAYNPNGVQKFVVDLTGSLELGAVGATNTPFIDFHTHTTGKDYDTRIIASAGTANIGEGVLSYTANIHNFKTSVGGVIGEGFRVGTSGGTTVNYLEALPAITAVGPVLQTAGTDTDIDLRLVPKGAGLVRFGTNTAVGAEIFDSFITIKDAGGTVRKLMVCA